MRWKCWWWERLEYSALFPAAVASFTASTVSGRLGLSNFHYILETEMSVSFPLLLQMALLGILFGIAGSCFAQGNPSGAAASDVSLRGPSL